MSFFVIFLDGKEMITIIFVMRLMLFPTIIDVSTAHLSGNLK